MSDFPVATLEEAIPHLRRPFSPDAIKWKVQTTWPKEGTKKGGMVVAYIDARLVIERLNLVTGGRWSGWPEPIPGNPKAFVYKLSIFGEMHGDVGVSTHSEKGIASDGLKRAAVHFGIGISIYSMSQIRLFASESGELQNDRPTLKQTKRGQKESAELTESGERWLREMYSRWLSEKVSDTFGDVLHHPGDPDAIGLEEEPVEGPADPGLSPEFQAQQQRVRELWEENVDKRKLNKAKFEQQLQAADTPEKLEGFAKTLGELS